ncbi:MAG: TolC family protein [Desulfovibrionaceae bacterium]|nr:TolC family protein [Desulfovibrionaceae bacterium]
MFRDRGFVGLIVCAGIACLCLFPFTANAEEFQAAARSALANSPEMESARKDVHAAESQMKVVLAEYLPQLSGTLRTGGITEDYADDSETYEETIARLSLSQEIIEFSKYYNIKKAGFEVDVAKAKLEDREQALVLSAAKAWATYWKALRDREINADNVITLADYVEGTELRYEAGELTIADVQLAKSKHEAALSQRNRFQRNLAAAKENYTQVMLASPPGDIALPEIDISRFELPGDEEAVSDHPSMRPLLKQAEANSMDVKRQRSGHLPSLSFESSVAHQTSGEYAHSRYPYNESTIGVVLKIPFFSGGGVYYATDRAQAAEAGLLAEMRDLHFKLVRDLNTARSNYEINREELEIAQHHVEYAKNTFLWMQEEFKLGTRTSVDVLLALSAMVDARLQLATAQEEHFTFIMDYLYALGILSSVIEDAASAN